MELICLKLSGSLLTEKSKPNTAKEEVIRRLAREIYELMKNFNFIIVHGGGSFGHAAAKKYKIHEGLNKGNKEQVTGFCETQEAMQNLNKIFVDIFLEEKVPVFPVQLSSSVILKSNKINKFSINSLEVMKKLIELNVIPVAYGVPCVDVENGIGILSGDEILVWLAKQLKAGRIISGSITEVLDDEGTIIPGINEKNIGKINFYNAENDVTGGMKRKVFELLKFAAESGIETQVVNLNEKKLRDVLEGRVHGTVIKNISVNTDNIDNIDNENES